MLAQPRQIHLDSTELIDLSKSNWRNPFRPNSTSDTYFLCLVLSGQAKFRDNEGRRLLVEESQYLCSPHLEVSFAEGSTGTVGCIYFTSLDPFHSPLSVGRFSRSGLLRSLFEKVNYRFLRRENMEAAAALSVILDELDDLSEVATIPADRTPRNNQADLTNELQHVALKNLRAIDWTKSQSLNLAASRQE